MAELTLAQAAALVGGHLHGGRQDAPVRGVAPLEDAGPDQISLLVSPRYLERASASRAAAILVAERLAGRLPDGLPRLEVGNVHRALRPLLEHLHPEPAAEPGVDPTARVAEGAEIAPSASVGPYVVIGAGCVVGAGAVIGAHSVLGPAVRIGDGTRLHPHVTLYRRTIVGRDCEVHSGVRLGSDGFGFVPEEGVPHKIPQIGGCRIGDGVEIGANVTIDRGSIGDTVVGDGTKIDNLVHIGHNVRIGRGVLVVAQVGISGSTTVGDGAVLGGQAGLGGHLRIGAGARVGAQAGVTADVAAGEAVSGYPARPHREALRAQAALFRLPETLRRLRADDREGK